LGGVGEKEEERGMQRRKFSAMGPFGTKSSGQQGSKHVSLPPLVRIWTCTRAIMNVFSFDSQDQDGEVFGEAV
jgi:hypothetical protein